MKLKSLFFISFTILSINSLAQKYHDAAIYGLKGNVKKVVEYSVDGEITTYFFNKDGQEIYEDGELKYEYEYDYKNYPLSKESVIFFLPVTTNYVFDDSGNILSSKKGLEEVRYKYSDGECIAEEVISESILGYDEYIMVYRIKDRDHQGNWTERIILSLDNDFDDNGNIISVSKEIGKERREIEYWNNFTTDKIFPASIFDSKGQIALIPLINELFGFIPYGEMNSIQVWDELQKQCGNLSKDINFTSHDIVYHPGLSQTQIPGVSASIYYSINTDDNTAHYMLTFDNKKNASKFYKETVKHFNTAGIPYNTGKKDEWNEAIIWGYNNNNHRWRMTLHKTAGSWHVSLMVYNAIK